MMIYIGGIGHDTPTEGGLATTAPVATAVAVEAATTATVNTPSSVVVGSKVVLTPSTAAAAASTSPAKGATSYADPVLYEYNQEGQIIVNNATANFKEKMAV